MEMNEEDQDTYILAEDGKLDLDELFRADILLALPTKYLCKEDCKRFMPSLRHESKQQQLSM